MRLCAINGPGIRACIHACAGVSHLSPWPHPHHRRLESRNASPPRNSPRWWRPPPALPAQDLAAQVAAGHEAACLFIIQRADCGAFAPCHAKDPEYGRLLLQAQAAGGRAACMPVRTWGVGVEVAGRRKRWGAAELLTMKCAHHARLRAPAGVQMLAARCEVMPREGCIRFLGPASVHLQYRQPMPE